MHAAAASAAGLITGRRRRCRRGDVIAELHDGHLVGGCGQRNGQQTLVRMQCGHGDAVGASPQLLDGIRGRRCRRTETGNVFGQLAGGLLGSLGGLVELSGDVGTSILGMKEIELVRLRERSPKNNRASTVRRTGAGGTSGSTVGSHGAAVVVDVKLPLMSPAACWAASSSSTMLTLTTAN